MQPIRDQILLPATVEPPRLPPGTFSALLPWYRNKARKVIETFTIPALTESAALGEWKPGVSRRVRATLNKTHPEEIALAIAGARQYLNKARTDDDHRCIAYAHIDVEFTRLEPVPFYLSILRSIGIASHPGATPAAQAIRYWCEAFAPISELVTRLDNTRPKPTYVFAAVSPSVWKNIGETMGLQFSSVRQPEVIWKKVALEVPRKNGVGTDTKYVWFAEIQWPEGTQHHKSKFSWGSKAGNDLCEACGHAIRRANNWAPLLLDGPQGIYSLWVGTDCARTLFGAKVTGDPTWTDRRAHVHTGQP